MKQKIHKNAKVLPKEVQLYVIIVSFNRKIRLMAIVDRML